MKYELYEVGGRIRDYFLGLESKDIDYSVVLPNLEQNPTEAFKDFCEQIEKEGFSIFLKTPSMFTVRAMFPKDHRYSGVADFVLSRKELDYIKGTRVPRVVLGSLLDDLQRRDFTVNCMAMDSDGNIVDYFGGQADLQRRILRTPMDAGISFNDDPLRLLRAMRFKVTKNFTFSGQVIDAIKGYNADQLKVVSSERVREELHKMFKHSTMRTLETLEYIKFINPRLYTTIMTEFDFWLEPTNKK